MIDWLRQWSLTDFTDVTLVVRKPSRDLTDVTLVSEDHDGPDNKNECDYHDDHDDCDEDKDEDEDEDEDEVHNEYEDED